MNAPKDANNIPVFIGALSTDGSTPTPVYADPTEHYIHTQDGTTGSDLSGDIAPRDGNLVPVGIATSEVDGVTPVVLYVNGSGQLLIDSN